MAITRALRKDPPGHISPFLLPSFHLAEPMNHPTSLWYCSAGQSRDTERGTAVELSPWVSIEFTAAFSAGYTVLTSQLET